MNIIKFVLELLIVFSILACLTVITSTNPIIAIIYLIGVFLSAAIYLIFLGLNFIGISYILIYVGAITVLFLFVIMLINIDLLEIIEIGDKYTKNIPLILTISGLFTYLFLNLLSFNELNFLPTLFQYLTSFNALFGDSSLIASNSEFTNAFYPDQVITNLIQIEIIGINIYTTYSSLLIITGFVLLLAMTAPILILHNKNSSKPN